MNQQVTESPKPLRLVLAPLQRLRRRTTAADDNNHGGVSGHVVNRHVTDAALPVIDERSSASVTSSSTSDFRGSLQNGERAETLLDAMHKKYYPDQYGVAAGSDVRGSATSFDASPRGTMKIGTKTRPTGNSAAACRSTTTTSIIGDSPDGATRRVSPEHVRGNCEIW